MGTRPAVRIALGRPRFRPTAHAPLSSPAVSVSDRQLRKYRAITEPAVSRYDISVPLCLINRLQYGSSPSRRTSSLAPFAWPSVCTQPQAHYVESNDMLTMDIRMTREDMAVAVRGWLQLTAITRLYVCYRPMIDCPSFHLPPLMDVLAMLLDTVKHRVVTPSRIQ